MNGIRRASETVQERNVYFYSLFYLDWRESMRPSIGTCMTLILVGLSLTLSTTGFGANGDPQKGKQVFQQFCQACHGPQGKGNGPLSMTLKPPPANLTGDMVKAKPDSELLNVIRKGKAGTQMPAWEKQLSEQQMLDVVAYVRSLGK